MVTELKQISETANCSHEENEFDVFGKHVALQLKSMPLLLALDAQEHIQMFLNRTRRQHLIQNRIETFTNTLMGSPLPGTSSDESYDLIQSPQMSMREPLPTATSFHEPPIDSTQSAADVIASAMSAANTDFTLL